MSMFQTGVFASKGYHGPKMIIFDFDGVLMSSLDEVVLTVYNAAVGDLVTSAAGLPGGLGRLFRRNRFHVQQIGDGLTLMSWCISNYQREGDRILAPDEYRRIISGSAVPLAERTRRVYESRSLFIETDPDRWYGLHQPFQPLWNVLKDQQTQPVVILTHKNRDATRRLCRYFGLDVEENNIYSGDHSVGKVENIRSIFKRFRSQLYHFIDDSIKNLHELNNAFNSKNRHLELLFASWGYKGPEDEEVARLSGYPIFSQEETIRLLISEPPK